MNRILVLSLFGALLAASSPALVPARHGDFNHYTFALTWQPGICAAEKCLPDEPKAPLIGLHGLWASLPESLSVKGVVNPEWWSKGCDYYRHSDAPPPLDASLHDRLEGIMPHFHYDLLTHEYDKHVQCFGFDATRFFAKELAMRQAVVSSSFGKYLMQNAGRKVDHADVVKQFQAAFKTNRETALQLRCEKTASGELVFAQFWMTIASKEIGAFPKASSFMETTPNQDSCPSRLLIPDWNV
jgi:ribonuclease I